jgi:hypothetical protein
VSSPGFHLHLRLFLEGLEVPVIGASVTTQIGSAATANIQVVPDDALLELLPRTVVHLFVLDSMEFAASGRTQRAGDDFYKLLFCGEVSGVQFSKAGAGSRSASLNCMDFSNVWDTNYAFSLNFGASSGDATTIENRSAFLAISQPSFDNIIQTPATLVRLISQQRPQAAGQAGAQSVLGGLFSVLEALSGVQGAFMGAGPWPTVQERRTRVLDSIVSDSGETAAALYSAATFSEWLKGRQGQVGAVSSFRDTINMILGFIFYDFVPNPAPKYIRGEDAEKEHPGRDVPYSSKGALREKILSEFSAKDGVVSDPRKLINLNLEFLEKVVILLSGLKERVGDPLIYKGPGSAPGGEDTGYKFDFRIHDGWREDDVISTAHERGFAIDIGHPQFSGRLFAGSMPFNLKDGVAQPTLLEEAVGVQGKFRHVMYQWEALGKGKLSNLWDLEMAAQDEAYRRLWASGQEIYDDIQMLKALSAWVDVVLVETDKDPDLQSGGDPLDWPLTPDPLFALVGVANDPVHVQDRHHKTKFSEAEGTLQAGATGRGVRERLNSFIFRPNIWFAAPPRCNVIYPDQVTSFSMQRAMLRETTRLQLNIAFDQIKEKTKQLDRLAFAPKLVGEEQNVQKGLGSADKVIIHDHEVYSGVIPKFERASDLLYYRLKGVETGSGTESESRIDTFADRLAHFHLLSNRYLSRSASVAGVFNLNLVCGFPGVVVGAPLSAYELQKTEKGARSDRVHWLGMLSSVTHSITQGGAQTNVSLTHVRSHRTGDRTDDLFSENINSSGQLTIQSRAEILQGQGIFSVESGTSIGVLNSTPESVPSRLGLPLDEDPNSLYFWEALGVLIGDFRTYLRNLPKIYGDRAGFLIDPSTFPPTDLTATGVQAGQSVAIPEVPVPGGKTTKGVIWTGPPTTVAIRARGSMPPGEEVVAVLEVDSPFSIQNQTGGTITQFVKEKKSAAFWDSEDVHGVVEFLVTLPGSTLTVEEVDADARLGLPVEEAIRPSWISSDYSTEKVETGNITKISERVYLPFFGSPCIVDRVLSEDPPEGLVRHSVEQAVDRLVWDYSEAVDKGSRYVLQFIHGSTHRKVATLREVLADKTQKLGPDGWVHEPRGPGGFKDRKYARYGGFHSNAVNFGLVDYGSELEFLDLEGPLRSRYGSGREDLSKQITNELDPRAERARRVIRYRGQVRAATSLTKRPRVSLSPDGEDATIQNTPLGIAKRG